jgi:superfamily II DNA or RNA helicase
VAMDLFASLGVIVEIEDRRNRGAVIDVSFNGVLRPDQEAAVDALLPHDIGVLAATTAFGKTVVAARMIAERGVNVLVLVHRRQLMYQWVERLGAFLNQRRP